MMRSLPPAESGRRGFASVVEIPWRCFYYNQVAQALETTRVVLRQLSSETATQ